MPIETSDTGTTITGNGIEFYRLLLLKQSLGFYVEFGIPLMRIVPRRVMLGVASSFTQKQYPASKQGAALALADITALIEAAPDADSIGRNDK